MATTLTKIGTVLMDFVPFALNIEVQYVPDVVRSKRNSHCYVYLTKALQLSWCLHF